jgi:hypothetical protein
MWAFRSLIQMIQAEKMDNIADTQELFKPITIVVARYSLLPTAQRERR